MEATNQNKNENSERRCHPYVLYLLMIFVQLGLAGLTVLGDLALNDGMTPYTFVVYRHLIATLLIMPFALCKERNALRRLTNSTFLKIVLLGFLEPVMDQNMFFFGMRSTSASITSIMSNSLPAITFVLAWILKIERVNLSEGSSKMKILGTVISAAGAVSMPLYKGQCLVRGKSVGHVYHRGDANKNSISGFFLLLGSFSSWSSYMIFQAMVLRDYPFELTVAGLTCLSGTVLGIAAEIILEHDIAAWKLHVGWKLYTIIYAGVVVSGMSFCIQGYVTKEKGPVFVTAFSPLSMIVVSIFGLFFLEEDLLVGRLIGAVVITLGLYMVIWGKRGDNRVLPQEPQEPQEVVLPEIPIVLPKQDIVLSPHNGSLPLPNIYKFCMTSGVEQLMPGS